MSYFQGGDFVELLSAQGKAPAASWKLQGKVAKSFEKLIKGNAFLLDGSADTRMQLPKGSGASTAGAASASLGLTQRFLVLQLLVPFTKSFLLEVGFVDLQRARRRFVISSAFREPIVTALHAQIPLSAAAIPRDSWMNLVLDLQTLTDTFFGGSVFRSMESLTIGGSCRLKRVFTMKDPPSPSGCVSGYSSGTVDIPKQFLFSCGKDGVPVPTEYFSVHGQAVGDAKLVPEAAKRTGSAGPGVAKAKSVVGSDRKTDPDVKKKVTSTESAATGSTTARRAGAFVSRGGKPPRVLPRGVSTTGVASEDADRDESPQPKASRVTPHQAKKLQEARLITPTRAVNADLDRVLSRQQSHVLADSEDKRPSDHTDLQTPRSPDLRPVSAASIRSNASARPPTPYEQQASRAVDVAEDALNGLNDQRVAELRHARPGSRPTSSRGGGRSTSGSRSEIMSEIQHKIELLTHEDEREGDRNRELFLRHTTFSQNRNVDLDWPGLRPSSEGQVALGEQCRGSINVSCGPKSSIFAFYSRSVDAERSNSPGLASGSDVKAVLAGVPKNLFDFDSLLDPLKAPERSLGSVTAVPTDSLMEETTPHVELIDTSLIESVDDPEDSSSDNELELLLAAKRAARREQQQQTQPEPQEPSRSDGHTRGSEQGGREPSEAERKSASSWTFGSREAVLSDGQAAKVAEEGGGEDADGDEGDELSIDRALQDECERDTGVCGGQDEEDDDLSIDLTGELEDLEERGDGDVAVGRGGGGDCASEPLDTTPSPVIRPKAGNAPQLSASRASDRSQASTLSTSFDFGDLMEFEGDDDGVRRTKLGVRGQLSADMPLNTSSVMFPSTASPVVAGESSTSKRLQHLLESTEWRALPSLGPESASSPSLRPSVPCQELGEREPTASSSAAPASNSIELVYDPVLRCYYDPVAGKYYALAK